MQSYTEEALARITYSLEVARNDLEDLTREMREEEQDTALAECIEIHLSDALHWLQEVEGTEGLDLPALMEVFVPANDSNREERQAVLQRTQQHRLPAGGNHTPEGDYIEQDLRNDLLYCEHGTFIGNPYGGDYLCHWCEMGIEPEEER